MMFLEFINWLRGSVQSPGPDGLVLGRGRRMSERLPRPITLPHDLRNRHAYVIGATRSGKTKALEGWIRQDIAAGRGVAVLDPHGDLTSDLIDWMATLPHFDPRRLVLVDLADPANTVGFNPLEHTGGVELYPLVLELVGAFRRLWHDAWGARMEEILRNTCLTLAAHGHTLVEAHALLTDATFRDQCCRPPTPQAVIDYWRGRFEPLPARERAVWIESTLNKVNTFVADPRIRAMIGQRMSTVQLRPIMDDGQVLLVNLARGQLKDNAFLLGALLLAKLQMAAMGRVDTPRDQRRPFHLYVDEFQTMATSTFAELLAESAKFGLVLHLAHQNLEQIDEQLRAAVLSNCGTQIAFRVGRADAEILAKSLFTATGDKVKTDRTDALGFGGPKLEYWTIQEEWEYYIRELTHQAQRQAYARTPDDGPWVLEALTLSPARPSSTARQALVAGSARHYATPRATVEADLAARAQSIGAASAPPHTGAPGQPRGRHGTKRPATAEDLFGESDA